MNVLVLMAGEGQRFKKVGIDTPKPFIKVLDKAILEWTTRSIPQIRHYDETVNPHIPEELLYFAVRADEEEFGTEDRLKDMYGDDINIISFNRTTAGNLETAYICASTMDPSAPLLILDADNKYNDNNLLDTINDWSIAHNFVDSMVVSYFDPIDSDPKWAYVISNGALVTEIVEKDVTALQRGGRPLIGTFCFSSVNLFMKHADFILRNGLKTGIKGKEEFFMSQVPALFAANGGLVLAHKVTNVVPLGTPEDVDKYKWSDAAWANFPMG
jgi:NDP-sugar pyrophosphorylase family protein